MKAWLKRNGKTLIEFVADRSLLAAIAQLDKRLDRDDPDSDLEDVFAALDSLVTGGEGVEKVREALDEAGIDVDQVKEQFALFRGLIESQIPEKYRALTYPLGSLETPPEGASRLIEWPVLELEGGPDMPELETVTFSLSATTGMTIDFEALPKKWPNGVPDDLPSAQIRIGLKGALSAEAGAELPFTGGGAKLGVEGSVETTFNWYFRNESTLRYATALANDLKQLCSPFDLKELDERLNRDGTPRLAAMQMALKGELGIGGEMAIVTPLTIGALPASVDLKFSYRARRRGHYRYVVYGNGGTVVRLQRGTGRSDETTLSFAPELDLTPVYTKFRPLLQERLAEAAGVIEKFDDILSRDFDLHESIADQLEQLLEGLEEKALIKAVLGFDPERSASQILADRLMTEVETTVERWSDDIQKSAVRVVEKAVDSLGLPPALIGSFRDDLIAQAVAALSKEGQRLEARVTELVEDRGFPALADALNKIDGIDAHVRKSVSGAQNRVKELIDPIRKVLAGYQKEIAKLRAALEKATEMKLAAEFTQMQSIKAQEDAELALRFPRVDEEAERLYREMMTGSVERLHKVLGNPATSDIAEVLDCRLKRVVGLDRSQGLKAIVFGMEFGSTGRFSSDTEYEVNGAGDVTLVSRARIERCRKSLTEGRCINFVNVFALAAAKQTRDLSISLSLSQNDEDLSVDDVKGFFSGMEKRGLLGRGATRRALDLLRELDDDDPSTPVKGKLDIEFMMNGDRVPGLLGLGIHDEVVSADSTVLRLAAAELKTAAMDMDYFNYKLGRVALGRMKENFPKLIPELPADFVEAVVVLDDEMLERVKQDIDVKHEEVGGPLNEDIDLVYQYHRHAQNMVRLVSLMRAVYLSQGGAQPWELEAYQKAQKDIDDCLRGWLKIETKWFVLLDEKVRPLTIAFIRILARLAGYELNDPSLGLIKATFTVNGKVYNLTDD